MTESLQCVGQIFYSEKFVIDEHVGMGVKCLC